MKIRVADYAISHETEGPGKRFTIWVQGCSIRCKGCWNKDLWNFAGGKEYEINELVDIILKHKDEIDGITLVGGEPLDQVEEVLMLMQKMRKMELSVVLYTGYDLHEIERDERRRQAFKQADIVIYGPFIEEQKNLFLRWRGSENQVIHINNPNYSHLSSHLMNINEVEIQISDDGKVKILGYPSKEIIKVLIDEL